MVEIFNFDADHFFYFFLILVRVSGLIVTAPILSADTVPRPLRVYLTLLITLILINVIPFKEGIDTLNTLDFFLLALKELMVGLLLGVVPRVLFAAIDFAGTIIGFQMGLSISNVVDPQTDAQVSIIASFEGVVATLIFLALDGHHVFFDALSFSYQAVPIGGFQFTDNKIDFLIRITANLFIIGLKLGAPIIIALLLANIILGFMARSIPQMNIFVVGFPFTIGLGLIMLYIGLPQITQGMSKIFNSFGKDVAELIRLMAH